MLAHWYGLLLLDSGGLPPYPKPDKEETQQGGLHGLKAVFRGVESEEQKQLRREAQGIIQRIAEVSKPTPEQRQELKDDSAQVSRRMHEAIALLNAEADRHQQQREQQQAQEALYYAESLLEMIREIDANIEATRRQEEEQDITYIMMMFAAYA